MGIAGFLGISGEIHRSLSALKLSPENTTQIWKISTGQIGLSSNFPFNDATYAASLPGQPHLLLLLDGSIHDRDSLLTKLNIADREISDAALLLNAYLEYQEDFPKQVVGEYCFALWDQRRFRLLLGVDPIGTRGFYYWQSGSAFRFASELRGLATCHEVPLAPDDLAAARWLTLQVAEPDGTFFKDIKRVPPGSVLVLEQRRQRVHRYWCPENTPPLRIGGPTERAAREYADGLLHHLQAAVQCRIPADVAIGMQLSGGLDSSTVTVLAAELLAAVGRGGTAFTSVPVGPVDSRFTVNRFGDERPYAASVVERYPNLEHVLIPNNAAPLFEAIDSYSLSSLYPILNTSNSTWLYGIELEAQRRGLGVMLYGSGGNMTSSFNSKEYVLHSLLARGRLLDWFRMMQVRRSQGRSLKEDLRLSLGFGPAITRLMHLVRSVVPRSSGPQADDIGIGELYFFSGISPQFFQSSGLPLTLVDDPFSRQNDSRLVRIGSLQRGDRASFLVRSRRRFGLQLADPTADRRVIEFCLSVPDEFYCTGGRQRSLVRDAMQGRLPDMVRLETLRGLQAADADYLLAENRADITAEVRRMAASDLCNKYLDMPTLTGLIDNWPSGAWPTPAVKTAYEIKLMRSLSFGRFIRQMEDGSLYASLR